MNRSIRWKLVSLILPVAAVGLASTHDAGAQVVVVVRPPHAYVASYEPVYYNGYAHYWYGNRWYYRDHATWRWYDREPLYLYERRGEWAHHAHHWR
jgi:hypothetical protein